MWLTVCFIILILLGLFIMWIAIFGNKREIREFGPGIPTDLLEFLFMIIYRLLPTILRRAFLFLLGFSFIIGGMYLLLFRKW